MNCQCREFRLLFRPPEQALLIIARGIFCLSKLLVMKKWVITLLVLCIYVSSQAQSYDPMYGNRQHHDYDPMYAQGLQHSLYPLNLRAGAGIYYSTDIASAGIVLTGICKFSERWEASFAYTHYLEEQYPKLSAFDLDLHFIFDRPEQYSFNVYVLTGLSVLGLRSRGPMHMTSGYGQNFEILKQEFKECLNIGLGLNYALAYRLNLAPELKFVMLKRNNIRLGATLHYKF